MTGMPRTMISFVVGPGKFNYRVAGVALREGHVLTCREDDDDYVMLPGGRVEMGEATTIALAREIAEELHTVAEIRRLLFVVENFFVHQGVSVHEIGTYYLIDLPPDFPFQPGGVCFETEDEGHRLTFEWVPVESEALRRANLLPPWLDEKLRAPPEAAEHLILHEQR
jgi:8-oxo-dGTP pyrophosphatase MutT (NUDIX family)